MPRSKLKKRMNNERKTQKEVTWSWRSFHFATLQNTKKQNLRSLLTCVLLSLRIANLKLPPPPTTNFPNFLHNRKKLAKNSKKQMWFPQHKGFGFAEVFGCKTMRNISSLAREGGGG
jgi:hypothetical protein